MGLKDLKSGTVITEFEMDKLCHTCGKRFSISNGTVEVTDIFVEHEGNTVARYLKLLSYDDMVIECEETAEALPLFAIGFKVM